MGKIKKLFKNPNMFFFDMFQNRLVRSVAVEKAPPKKKGQSEKNTKPPSGKLTLIEPVRSPTTKSQRLSSRREDLRLSDSSAIHGALLPAHKLKEFVSDTDGLGFKKMLAETYDAVCGVEDGCDERSLLLWSGYLIGTLRLLKELRLALSINISLYTLGGGYARQFKIDDDFDIGEIYSDLLKRPDFVLEVSSAIGYLEVLRLFLFDVNEEGLVSVRSSRAIVKKFPVNQIKKIYFSRRERWPAIDAVYTWVDHRDPGWQELWQQEFPGEKLDLDRYAANDELRFSMRSLNKFAPWLRKIHIVSNCERPQWLAHHEKIHWVAHQDIFPDPSNLPTFNSHSIESCLHRVPGLSEKFIYMNDDFMLNQPCLPRDFFDEVGRSMSYFEPYGMVSIVVPSAGLPDYLVASMNSKALLKELDPDYDARNLHRHFPYALKRSILDRMECEFPDAFLKVRKAKRRSPTDINVTSFLYHHFALQKGEAVKGEAATLIVRPRNIAELEGREGYKYKMLCFNDGDGSASDSMYKQKTRDYLQKHLGEVAPWERPLR